VKRVKDLVAEAEAEIETLSPADAIALFGDADVQFIDLRESGEWRREGRIPGAFGTPRGLIEFWADPESPYHKPVFASGKRLVLFCALGWRSALATQTLKRMGLDRVCHIGGGFTAWKQAGGTVEPPAPPA